LKLLAPSIPPLSRLQNKKPSIFRTNWTNLWRVSRVTPNQLRSLTTLRLSTQKCKKNRLRLLRNKISINPLSFNISLTHTRNLQLKQLPFILLHPLLPQIFNHFLLFQRLLRIFHSNPKLLLQNNLSMPSQILSINNLSSHKHLSNKYHLFIIQSSNPIRSNIIIKCPLILNIMTLTVNKISSAVLQRLITCHLRT
jgi:hypothetical protein